MDVFASFGFDLSKQDAEPVKPKQESESMDIPVPDFNTIDFKVRRILDLVPDLSHLI